MRFLKDTVQNDFRVVSGSMERIFKDSAKSKNLVKLFDLIRSCDDCEPEADLAGFLYASMVHSLMRDLKHHFEFMRGRPDPDSHDPLELTVEAFSDIFRTLGKFAELSAEKDFWSRGLHQSIGAKKKQPEKTQLWLLENYGTTLHETIFLWTSEDEPAWMKPARQTLGELKHQLGTAKKIVYDLNDLSWDLTWAIAPVELFSDSQWHAV